MHQSQNKMLHALLAQTNLIKHKADLVSGICGGRTEKSSELNSMEANELINYLRTRVSAQQLEGTDLKADKMRKKMISFARQMNWTKTEGATVMCDMRRLNDWCVKYSYLHKKLNAYKYVELPKLLTQFEAVYNSYLKDL